MREVTAGNFGLLIAYVLPGFVTLWGVSYFSQTVRSWLGASPADAPTVGGFLYVTLASVAAGITVSTVRWAVIDTLHHWTGIREPRLDFSRLAERVAAFDVLVEVHYRYYQAYANMVAAGSFLYVARRVAIGSRTEEIGSIDLGFALLVVVSLLGSRDTLRRYYTRTEGLLGSGTREHRGGGE